MRIENKKTIFLSYILDENTPAYGDRNRFLVEKKSDISKGDVANDSSINTTVHIGTHIDMPYHFYEDGQTIEDFSADFWRFTNPLVVVGPPFEVSVGVRNTNKRKPIQIQYVFEYFDSYGRKTTQNTDWDYYSLPASVEMQLSGVSIAESTKSWRLRIRPAK